MKSINVGYKEKNTKRQVRKQTLFAIVLLIAMIASSTVGFSLALFANSTSANATFTFGRLQTEISINGGTTYTTQNEAIIPLGEFSQGETVVQAQGIKVRTVENGMPAYMRVRVFYRATEQTAIDTAVALNSALSITANSWSANDINNPAPLRYYYLASGEPLALNACEPNTPITFNNTAIVLPDLASFNLSNYSTNSLQLVIEAQSVQEEHLGVATIAELEQLISENNVFATPQVQGYFVRFDTMGGPAVTNKVVSSNGTSTVTMPTVGGVSVNWYTTNALTGPSVASGSTSSAITTNTTFYAKYGTSNNQIYVFFEKGNEIGVNGDLPTNGIATLNSSNYVTNAPNSLTRDGYTHVGWKIKGVNNLLAMSGSNVQIPQAQVTVGHAVTLVPAWSANEYTATFNANGGTVSPNSDTYNIEGTLTFPTATKAGETFMGWKVNSTVNRWRANDVYTSGVFNTAGYFGAVSFTALWSSTSENVTLDKRGGIGGSSQIVATPGSALPSNIELPTKQGYTFGGFYTAPNGAGTQFYLAGGSPTATEWSESYNAILHAKWTANTYTITFDKQSGTSGTSSVTATYGSAMPSATAPTRTGYTFAGYYDATNDGTQYYTSGMASAKNWDKASNTTLYAHWTATTYTIAYDLGGGTVATANPTTYTIETSTFTLNNPTKEGFVFTGWTGTGLPSASTSVTINQGSTGNKTFTANWLSAVARVGSTYFATLSDAISAVSANSSATIELIGNTSESGLTIGNDKNITLVASGANRTITRNADATLFVIDNGATLTLGASTSSANYLILDGNYYNKRVVNNQGILTLNVGIIQGGSNRESAEWASYVASGYGGGVLNGKTFNMNGGTIQNCKAAGAGGGVYSAVGSNMQMSGNATITNNTATGNGGGVCACSTFNMNGGTISNNTAVNGGGLRITIDGAVTMSGGTITGNETTGSGGGVDSVGLFIMNGGVISSNIAITNGAGVYILNGTFTFSGGTIKGNEATVDGGGVYQDGGTFTMDNANSVIGDLEEPNLAGRNGGAVYQLKGTFNFSAGTIGNSSGATVTNGTVMDTNAGSFANKASHLQNGSGGGIYQGGGTLNLSGNAIVARNYSAYRTGGIYSQSTMTINGAGVHISYNIATNLAGGLKTNTNSLFTFTAGNIHNNKASHGGGICVAWDCVTPDKKLINGENAKIYNNVATSGGGGIYFEAWTGGSSATAVAGAGKLTMTAGEIKDNIATVGGGGISMMSSSNATTNTHATSEFKMSGGKISGNSAKDGGAIYGSGATIILSGTVVIELNEATNATTGGGAIYLANGSVNLPASLTMSAVEIKNNISASNGGGVYLASGTFNMYGGTISSNSAVDGGGVYQASGTFNMNGGVIGDDTATTCATSNEGEHSNYASGNGGGICSVGGDLNIIGGTIAYNYAVQNGGGIIYTDNSAKDFVLDGVNINYNFANSTNGGGGVYVNGLHSFTVTGTTMIKGNGATNRGGGIRSCIAFTMTGGTVQGNFLVQSGLGGGMYISSGTINATGSNNVLITENSIPLGGGGGGAIYTGSYITIGKCTISSNTSQGSAGVHVNAGGGIMNSDSAIIKENNATGNGGGLFVKAGTFTIDAGTIYGADGGENANTGNGSALYNQSGTVQIKKINGSYHTVASGGVINTTIHAPLGMVTYDMNGGNLPTGVHTNTAYQSVSNVVVTGGLLSTGTVNAGQMMFENEVIFDGTDDYISLGNNYKYTNALTVSLWAYMDNWADIWTSSSNYMILFSSAESGGYSINPQSSTGKILMQVRIGGSYKAVVANKTFASLASGWHNFAFTFDGASTNLVGYVDGVSIGQTVAGSEISYHATNSVLVGAEAKTGDTPKAGYYFNGKVKGVNILNQALDATQINSLMNSITQNVTNRSALSGANMPTPTRDGYEFAGWGLLPDEYQLVEYLQSNGSQYINTGFPAGDDVGINIDYARIGNVDTIVMGSNGTGESRLAIGLYTGNSVRFGWNTYSATIPINADVKMNMKLNYLNNRQELFNNELFAQINTTLDVSNTFNISMFAGNWNGTTNFKASTKIYGAQITKGNYVARNFIPCVRKADNKPGMFDTVTNTFYVNNGTGEFAVGRNLNLADETGLINTSDYLKLYAKWVPNTVYLEFKNGYDTNLTSMFAWGNTNQAPGAWTHSGSVHTYTFSADSVSGQGVWISGLEQYMLDGESYRIGVHAKASTNVVTPMRFEASAINTARNISLTTTYQWFYMDVLYSDKTQYYALTFYSSGWMNGYQFIIDNITIDKAVPNGSTFGPLPTPTRAGYTFNGWYSAVNGGGTQYLPTTVMTSTSNIPLYANWTVNSLTIDLKRIETNSTVNNYSSTVIKVGISESPTIGPASNLKTFNGSTLVFQSDANQSFIAGRTYYIWASKSPNEPNTLQFTDNKVFVAGTNATATLYYCELTLGHNEGVSSVSGAGMYLKHAINIAISATVKNGYHFSHWSRSSGSGLPAPANWDYINPSVIHMGATSKILSANGVLDTYGITYNLNGGSVASANPTTYNVTTATFSLNNPTKTGYTFAGWTGSNGTTAQTSVSIAVGSTGERNYSANWTATEYTISYTLNGGTTSNPTRYTIETPAFTLANPTRTGYNFKGWSGSGLSGTANTNVSIAKGSSGNKSYTANWTASTYTVTLNKQSGTSGTSSVTATYGSAMPSATAPTRTGYTFGGYYTSTNGGGTQYYNASMASVRNWDKTSATTLYANWTASTYTVTLNKQSGTGGTSSVTATYGSAMPSATAPTRTGYTFGGYYTSTNGGGTQYYNASMVSVRNWDKTSATTLYAKWTINQYTATFNGNGGSSGGTITKNYNTTLGTLPTSSRAGFAFNGWWTSTSGGTQITSSTLLTQNVTYYAHWETAVAQIGTKGYTSLSSAIDDVPANAPTIIELLADISISGLIIDGNKNITLVASGANWTITRNANSVLFTISSGATLTLGLSATDANVINIIGNNQATSVISNSGTLNLNSAKIYGGVDTETSADTGPYYGGGVNVYGSSAQFTMNGGTISGNEAFSGGGVYVSNSATFAMSGGLISGNSATDRGGGVSVYGSSAQFVMIGGNIINNTATSSGGGVYVSNSATFAMSGGLISGNTTTSSGGGVSVYGSSTQFVMIGGNIINNTATSSGGGVGVTNGTFEMYNGTISGNTTTSNGGGVYSSGTFTMSAGLISGNSATYNGGGVSVYGSSTQFVMIGGNIINNTTTSSGGGVGVSNGTFTMSAGLISGNSATYNGGGVHVSGSSTQFVMIGGNIINNTATSSGGGVGVTNGTFEMYNGTISGNTTTSSGGGVYSSGTFTMSAGLISGNTATSNGGGVYSYGTFTMTGGVVFGSDAGAVYANLAGNCSTNGNALYKYSGTVTIFGVDGGTSENTLSSYPVTSVTNESQFETAIGSNHVIIVNSNLTFSTKKTIPSGRNITIIAGIGNKITRNFDGVLFEVASGGTLTLDGGIKIIGNNQATSVISNSGTFNLGNANIYGGTNETTSADTGPSEGGGVYSTGTFNMYGGTISGNKATSRGGGVYSTGTFNMYGGIISGNTATSNGGGVYVGDGTFTMSGGTIYGSTAGANANTATTGASLYNSSGTAQYGDNATITTPNNDTIIGHA